MFPLFSRLNVLSKEYPVILDCSVLVFGPWKYLTSVKSFSCVTSRLPFMVSVRVCSKYNVMVPCNVVKYVTKKMLINSVIELTTKEMYGNQLGKLIFST